MNTKKRSCVHEWISGWVNDWVKDLTNVVADYFAPHPSPTLSDLVSDLDAGDLRFDPILSHPVNRSVSAEVIYHDRPGIRFLATVYVCRDWHGLYWVSISQPEQRNQFANLFNIVYAERCRQLEIKYDSSLLYEWATDPGLAFNSSVPSSSSNTNYPSGYYRVLLSLSHIYETPTFRPRCTLDIDKFFNHVIL